MVAPGVAPASGVEAAPGVAAPPVAGAATGDTPVVEMGVWVGAASGFASDVVLEADEQAESPAVAMQIETNRKPVK